MDLRVKQVVVFGGATLIMVLAISLAAGTLAARQLHTDSGEYLQGVARQMAGRLSTDRFERLVDLQLLAKAGESALPALTGSSGSAPVVCLRGRTSARSSPCVFCKSWAPAPQSPATAQKPLPPCAQPPMMLCLWACRCRSWAASRSPAAFTRNGATRPLLSLALTGSSDADDYLAARAAGMHEWLVKPLRLDDLRALLIRHPAPR